MPMPIEKATNIIRDYKSNNYNAKKTVMNNGYSESYARSLATKVVDNAYKTLAKEIINSDTPRATALSFTGLDASIVRDEYIKVIMQNKDLTNKLKALVPLLRELGVVFDDEKVQVKPTVNLTMVQNKPAVAIDKGNDEMGGESQGELSGGMSEEPSPKNTENTSFPSESNESSSTIDTSIIDDTNPGSEVSPEQIQ
jgi:hypothetical protein